MNIENTTNPETPAKFITERILEKLQSDKKVLWFITGGSGITVQVLAAKIISLYPKNILENLTVILTDERFGQIGHPDSNWEQSIKKGFYLPESKMLPILNGEDRPNTVTNFNKILERVLESVDYKIGFFGIGADGHTAGILPNSEAIKNPKLAFGYETKSFYRITITKKVIEGLDEAVVWMQGKEKWPVVKDLTERQIDISDQPAQILKSIPRLTIFTDYKN